MLNESPSFTQTMRTGKETTIERKRAVCGSRLATTAQPLSVRLVSNTQPALMAGLRTPAATSAYFVHALVCCRLD